MTWRLLRSTSSYPCLAPARATTVGGSVKRLAGKTAVITGAGQGIGQAIATAFAAEGANVGIVDVNLTTAAQTADAIIAAGGSAEVQIADVSNRSAAQAAVDAVVARFGRLDVLVNNAIWARFEPISEITDEHVDRMLGSGFKAAVWCIQGAQRHLRSGGTIINLSSGHAFVGAPNALVYSGIKAALTAMTRSAATELGPRGIRVVALAPGYIATPGATAAVDQAGYETRMRKIPLGRAGTPSDVARAAVFLASDDAGYITGEVLRVDAGLVTAFL
nr:glucose 1-dehydrogenase [Mycolicibacterium sp. P9-64]